MMRILIHLIGFGIKDSDTNYESDLDLTIPSGVWIPSRSLSTKYARQGLSTKKVASGTGSVRCSTIPQASDPIIKVDLVGFTEKTSGITLSAKAVSGKTYTNNVVPIITINPYVLAYAFINSVNEN